MKTKTGKISLAVLFVIAISLLVVNLVIQPLSATPIHSDASSKLGGYTGNSGAGAADNAKADIDIVNGLVDTVIVAVNDNVTAAGATIAGQEYATVMTSLMIDDDMFDVDGGAILITSLVGVVTTNSQAQANAIEINLDADAGFVDYDFSTAVETNGDAAGTRYVISNANEGVFTPLEGADGGATVLAQKLFCGEGMIELNAAQAAHTGAIKWFMTWIPYEDGTTVTAQ